MSIVVTLLSILGAVTLGRVVRKRIATLGLRGERADRLLVFIICCGLIGLGSALFFHVLSASHVETSFDTYTIMSGLACVAVGLVGLIGLRKTRVGPKSERLVRRHSGTGL